MEHKYFSAAVYSNVPSGIDQRCKIKMINVSLITHLMKVLSEFDFTAKNGNHLLAGTWKILLWKMVMRKPPVRSITV